MNRNEAQKIAVEFLRKNHSTFELMIDEVRTLEKPYGWIFFFNSKEFLETGNEGASLYGCGPIVVQNEAGKITELGSSFRPEDKIAQFEAHLHL